MPESIPLSRKAVIDRISVAIFALAWTLMILRVAPVMLSRTTGPTGLFVLLSGIVAGYLLADLLAGVVHWIADRFFERDTRFLGPMLIARADERSDP